MPKKIDEILNPPPPVPPRLQAKILDLLQQAKAESGAALTFEEIWAALDLAWIPRGTGDWLLFLTVHGFDAVSGARDQRKDEVRQALDALVSESKVESKNAESERYYWAR